MFTIVSWAKVDENEAKNRQVSTSVKKQGRTYTDDITRGIEEC